MKQELEQPADLTNILRANAMHDGNPREKTFDMSKTETNLYFSTKRLAKSAEKELI